MFGFRFFQKMFGAKFFPKVGVVKTIDGLTLDNVDGKDVYIVVSKKKPQGCANFTVGQDSKVVFKARLHWL